MEDASTPGYVYALVNPAMPGLVKIGRTIRRPSERVAELTTATGVPAPFELVYDVLVPDVVAAEMFVHRALEARGYRLTQNREFFRTPIREVVGLLVALRERMEAVSFASTALAHAGADLVAHDDEFDDQADDETTSGHRDQLFLEAAEVCVRNHGGTASVLQRRLKIGYGRAARIIDELHAAGILGPPDGSKPRDVLIGIEELPRFIDGQVNHG